MANIYLYDLGVSDPEYPPNWPFHWGPSPHFGERDDPRWME